MIKLTKPGQSPYLKCLLAGETGVGKTTFLGTAQEDPRTSPVVILDLEGGTQSLMGLDVDVIRIRSWEELEEAYTFVAKSDYKSVAIDSVSETHLSALFSILEEEQKDRSSRGLPIDLFQQGDYGRASVRMRRLLRAFRDLDKHVFFTSLVQEVIEPNIGLIRKPALIGRLADEVPGLVDVVGFLVLAEKPEKTDRPMIRPTRLPTSRVMILKNHPQYRAKARTGWGAQVPDLLWEPTVSKLFDALMGGVK